MRNCGQFLLNMFALFFILIFSGIRQRNGWDVQLTYVGTVYLFFLKIVSFGL